MTKHKTLVGVQLLTLAMVLMGTPAFAQQPPTNPTTIEFDHVDYAVTDRYVLGYFSAGGATVPVQEGDLPKPSNCAPCSGPLVSRPTAFQTWYVAVRAIAGSVTSEWSELVPFVRKPLAPGNLRVR